MWTVRVKSINYTDFLKGYLHYSLNNRAQIRILVAQEAAPSYPFFFFLYVLNTTNRGTHE